MKTPSKADKSRDSPSVVEFVKKKTDETKEEFKDIVKLKIHDT